MRTSILTLAFLTPLGCGIDTTASLNADLDDAFNAEKQRFIEAREADVSAMNRASIQGKNNIHQRELKVLMMFFKLHFGI